MSYELKNFIGLHRVVMKMDRSLAKLFDEKKLSQGQFAVLEALYHIGDLSIGQVQEKILSSSGTMPLIVKNLVNRELIVKLSDPSDARRTILHITKRGQDLMDELFPKVEERIISLFDNLEEVDKKSLIKILLKLGVKSE